MTIPRASAIRRALAPAGLALLLAVCAALLLAACGGGDDGASSPTPRTSTPESGAASTTAAPSSAAATDSPATTPGGTGGDDLACLFTQAEAEQALGEPVGKATVSNLTGTLYCGYQPSPDRGVIINVNRGVSKEAFDAMITQSSALLHMTAQPVPGPGDEAVWLQPYLIVLKKDVSFRISVWAPQIGWDDSLKRATDLAMKAAGRIS